MLDRQGFRLEDVRVLLDAVFKIAGGTWSLILNSALKPRRIRKIRSFSGRHLDIHITDSVTENRKEYGSDSLILLCFLSVLCGLTDFFRLIEKLFENDSGPNG